MTGTETLVHRGEQTGPASEPRKARSRTHGGPKYPRRCPQVFHEEADILTRASASLGSPWKRRWGHGPARLGEPTCSEAHPRTQPSSRPPGSPPPAGCRGQAERPTVRGRSHTGCCSLTLGDCERHIPLLLFSTGLLSLTGSQESVTAHGHDDSGPHTPPASHFPLESYHGVLHRDIGRAAHLQILPTAEMLYTLIFLKMLSDFRSEVTEACWLTNQLI